ncbi:peptidoglycan bridge formation protein FemAB [Spirochaetia bacterium]|nr:peptidoglycan bridge formation protein FemAB [Spirochaetia bacterium]
MKFIKSIEPAELTLCDGAQFFLQSGFWGSFKARFGWNARAFFVDWGIWSPAEPRSPTEPRSLMEPLGTAPLMLIRRRLMPGISFAYVPWGPELPPNFPQTNDDRNAALAELALGLCRFLPRDTAFIRFDPPWYTEGADAPPPPVGKPFSRAGADVQPPDTVIVDLSPPAEAILAAMKPKWRYNIRLAEKKGVTVRRADEEGLEAFYALLNETAKRDGIAIHGIEYYRGIFTQARQTLAQANACFPLESLGRGSPPEPRLYLAEYQAGEAGGEVLAAIVVLVRGRDATYLYGASSSRNRNLMAPYALQWKAMEDAKASGCTGYDLFGIPPNDDPSHPMAGLYLFKTGFGGRIIHRPGSWDYAYRPLLKGLFTAAEGLRKQFRNLKKNRKS